MRLEVPVNTVHIWRVRGLLPEPQYTVHGSAAWEWNQIERWARKTGRLPEQRGTA